MFRLRIDPTDRRFASLRLRLAHENFTQSLVVAEEVGSVTEPVALPKHGIIAFGALLLLTIMSIVLYYAVEFVERLVVPWAPKS